ncbi:hypothetical protein BCR35DRAFT_305344 [Leucosporidium creatinivorum]|uniref:UDENN domain-containing protein n=1 Tax=Leucosporidium creatinivorum TaxID=106004 RepID=A0A1Y2F275_9BASI|nr:hypothetical protein BCR35DRAFT_305344 [Leucosporidium creatinivorum]
MNGDLGSVPSSALDYAYNPPAPSPPPPPAPAAHPASTTTNSLKLDTTQATLSPTAAAATGAADEMDQAVSDRLRRWIICFALVEFDLDTGPLLTTLYPAPPSSLPFPPSLQQNIAFSSLPEGDLPTAGAHAYTWRIPIPKPTGEKGKEREVAEESGEEWRKGDGCLHGFVWFVQEKNPALRRGYSQRSLVLITHLPSLPGLFSSVLSILGPMHFKHQQSSSSGSSPVSTRSGVGNGGEAAGAMGGMVEAASYNISSWPDLHPGTTLDLPFLGTVLSVEIPLGSQPQWPLPPPNAGTGKIKIQRGGVGGAASPSLSAVAPVIPASLPPTPLSLLLSPSPPSLSRSNSLSTSSSSSRLGPNISFAKLLLLWELILLGEPILVVSGNPREGGEVVEWLRGLIRPILFAGDYRPYFHIHDSDFARLTGGSKPPPATLLSTTNPLILSTCSKTYPHILRLHVGATESPGVTRGLASTRKRHVRVDKSVRREVEEKEGRGDYLAADALILQHLARLTEMFLAPLNRYFGTLPSSDTSLSSPPSSRSFTPSAFLTSLRQHGSSLPLRPSAPSLSSPSTSSLERFYLKFLQSPNFASWLHERMDRAGEQVREGYLRRLEGGDLREWMFGIGGEEGREEGEVEELVGRLEREAAISDRLLLSSNSLPSSPSVSSLASPGVNGNTAERGERLRNQAARLRSLRDESRGAGSGRSEGTGSSSDES